MTILFYSLEVKKKVKNQFRKLLFQFNTESRIKHVPITNYKAYMEARGPLKVSRNRLGQHMRESDLSEKIKPRLTAVKLLSILKRILNSNI
jgi:hypothetical protein